MTRSRIDVLRSGPYPARPVGAGTGLMAFTQALDRWSPARLRRRAEAIFAPGFENAVTSNGPAEAAQDAQLVAATLAGERAAFGHLVRRYQKRVFALAYRYVGNEADAADMTQRAFLKAFENLGRLRKPSSFAAWLFSTTANLAKNEIRFLAGKSFQDIEETGLAEPAQGESDAIRRSERRALREALARLPDKQRRCVLLRIDADLSFREIGAAVGCSEVSARVNFHHALRALRKILRPDDPTAAQTEGENP